MTDLYVTPEMVQAANARVDAALDHEERMALWLVALDQKPGSELKKPLVIDLDGPLHTAEQPVCHDEDCCCADCELQESLAQGRGTSKRRHSQTLISQDYGTKGNLNGRGGFSLLR